jgi:long-chain acyl-CoA synthetase
MGAISEKIWLKSYPEGVPATVDFEVYSSLNHLLDEAYKTYADRTSYTCMGSDMSFAQLDAHSKQVAAWLRTQGLVKGDRVAIMMPNVLQYPIAIAGILRAGMTVVNVNPLYTPRELKHQLNDSGSSAIFVLENFASVLQEVIADTGIKRVILGSVGDRLSWWKGPLINMAVRHLKKAVPTFSLPNAIRFNDMLSEASGLKYEAVQAKMDDVAFLQYTGGTTGVSKGATLTHRNIVANIIQTEAWTKPRLSLIPDGQQLVVVCALPLYHIFALTICNMMGARLGAMNILIPNPRDIPGFIKTLKNYRINMFPAVNTLFNGMVNHPDFSKLDFSKLVISNGGGMAVTRATAEKWFAATGCPIAEGYGLSETSPVATSNPPTANEFSGTIGLPVPNTDIAIRDENGKDLAIGETGEICIRGPQVMRGYWNRPDETAKVMYADGFFRSGDMGFMDERGHCKIVDRIKNMILVSGFNVYPSEIEEVVSMHPGVLECAAIGIPNENSGEEPRIYVVKKDPMLTERDVLEYAAKGLTNYKRPKSVEFRADLPKTNVGKILHRELRDEALKKINAAKA